MRLRSLLTLLIVAVALGLAACGGDGETADSSTDVDRLLGDTFAGGKKIESGKVDLRLTIATGGESFAAKLTGPFQSTGEGRFPEVDLDAALEGGGQSVRAGVVSTGDEGFVSLQGTDYAVAGPVFGQLKAQFEEAAKRSPDRSLATLGLDPRKWLTNARNAGEAKVGDTDTIKITGDVDVPKLLDDMNAALAKLRRLGGAQAENLPEQLTEQEKQQAAEAVKDVAVEIHTGAEDTTLRRLLVTLALDAPTGSGAQSADVRFDLQLLELNEDQEIDAPENARPFDELLAKIQGLSGAFGGIAAPGSGSGSGGGADPESVREWSECVREAGSDNDEVRKCADLLTP